MTNNNLQDERELLELAAKAVGVHELKFSSDMECPCNPLPESGNIYWNPLRCDGDAMRLAAKLLIDVKHRWADPRVVAIAPQISPIIANCTEETRLQVTRRAIVRAAAEIGRTLK